MAGVGCFSQGAIQKKAGGAAGKSFRSGYQTLRQRKPVQNQAALRAAEYRLVYEMIEAELVVVVIAVGKRENNWVYKKD